jgi:hypothetical protein
MESLVVSQPPLKDSRQREADPFVLGSREREHWSSRESE